MIRFLTPNNAFECASLHAISFPSKGWDKDLFEAWIGNELFTAIGYFHQEKLVGFVLGSLLDGELEIYTLCVAEICWGQGIGTQLVTALEKPEYVPDVKTIFLDVQEDNLAALRVYQKAGFRMISKRVGYYQDGDKQIDAVCMMKNILPESIESGQSHEILEIGELG